MKKVEKNLWLTLKVSSGNAILSIAAITLIMASLFACEQKAEEESNVPYKPCDCDNEKLNFAFDMFSGEATLFKDLPAEQSNQQLSHLYQYGDQGKNRVILYETKTDKAILYAFKDMMFLSYICNFPNFAKQWDIPQNGQKVYYSGAIYPACNLVGTANQVYTDIILTTLKLK